MENVRRNFGEGREGREGGRQGGGGGIESQPQNMSHRELSSSFFLFPFLPCFFL